MGFASLGSRGLHLGKYGVAGSDFEVLSYGESRELARRLERLGFSTLWLSEVLGREAFTTAQLALAATRGIVVGSAIVRALERVPKSAAAAQRSLWAGFPGRYLLGLGVSAASRERGLGPLPFMHKYLDDMDAMAFKFPGGEERPPRILGAYSEGLIRLAGEKCDGLITFLVTPEHTAWARSLLGPGPLLAVSQFVMVETDWTQVLEAGRVALSYYLGLPHQLNKFRALGFTEGDIQRPGSERLIDHMVAWGGIDEVHDRLEAHFRAGADQVVIGLLGPAGATKMAQLEVLSRELIV